MANLKEVRTRIASVSSTQQITSAMKMVSAAKFRRAQNAILGMRPYAAQLAEIVNDIDVEDGVQTPYHEVRQLNKVLLVVVTSNKGLCGAFNSNVTKEASARLQHYRDKGCEVKMITLGKRGTELFAKQEGLVAESYDDLLDNPTFDAVSDICDKIMAAFCNKEYDFIEIIYNQFKNSLTQILSTEQFLPVGKRRTENATHPAAVRHPSSRGEGNGERRTENGEDNTPRRSFATHKSALRAPQELVPPLQEGRADAESGERNDYIYEPDKGQILREMIPLTLRSQFYRVVLDSLAAEHGARMTAMQKATDNATELLKELRLSYNKARQAAITNEIIEIVSGSEALKG